jgi:hypothetical protein
MCRITRNAPDPMIRGVSAGRGQLALGSTDGAASEAAGVEAAGVEAAGLVGVGVAGVLQARTAPPSETVRARATRIRLIMTVGFLR